MLPALTAEEVYRLAGTDFITQALYAVWIRPFLDPDGTGIFQVRDLMGSLSHPMGVVDRGQVLINIHILEESGLVEYLPTDRPWSFRIFCPFATGKRRR